MSWKEVLGMGQGNDAEMMRHIDEARREGETQEFMFGGRMIQVRVKPVSREGIMREYDDYYLKKN
ncbi:hypothetical protein HYX14_04815 [Candidatus Woesearchaeota archaeon]|nr:hypothetical protein [Candidatus Woesearchaeota archaeon]